MTQPIQPKPMGKPLDLTDEAIDQAAQVTPFDIASARALWQAHAPKGMTDLLDAAPERP